MCCAQDFGFTFCITHLLLLHIILCVYLLSELIHVSLHYADRMLGQGKLVELRALARSHGLASGSQTVPNSVVEITAAQGRSPPKGPTSSEAQPANQRKKLILRKLIRSVIGSR